MYGWQTLALGSTDARDMHDYLQQVQFTMEKYNMTEGFASVIHWPEHNMAYIHRAVTGQVAQAELLSTLDPASSEYQSGMINLRKAVNNLDLQAHKYWYLNTGGIVAVLTVMFWLVFIVSTLSWMRNNQTRE